jgi:hypothetical protein
MIRLRNPQDLAAGLFLVLVAMLAYTFAADLPMGRLVRMGPGYVPVALSCLLGALGLLIAGRAFTIDGPRLEPWAWRPVLALTIALVVFALLLETAGLVVAIIVTTVVSAFAAPGVRVLQVLVLGVLLAILSTLLFAWLLGLPLIVWPPLGG